MIKSSQPKDGVLRLLKLVRQPSGSFMDDVSVIIVKNRKYLFECPFIQLMLD